MKKLAIFLIVLNLILLNSTLFAQITTIGTPFIENYNRAEYRGGSQTWDVQQGVNGMMYFANNDGLLEFDGSNWNIYNLPNNTILRSIENGNEGRMYAGGFDELGYYNIGLMGGAEYVSLTYLIPEERKDFGEVWKIYNHPDGIFFQTIDQLFIYKDDTIEIVDAPSIFHFSYMVNNEYYVNDMEYGLLRYAMGSLYPLKGAEKLIGKEVWAILPFERKLLIATATDGLYVYNGDDIYEYKTKSTEFLEKNQIYCAIRLSGNRYAFGTIQNGLLICDSEVDPIKFINKEDGLQNNTILCLGSDNLGNLWLGADQGIDYIQENLPLTQISYNYNVGTGYCAFVKDNRVYLGTNQGLLTRDLAKIADVDSKKMQLIEETKGQVWSLKEIDGTLFCGHNNGALIIEDSTAKFIGNTPGLWMFSEVPNNPNKIIGGTYTGLVTYKKDKGSWRFDKQLDGFSQSSRKMEFDPDGTLWITHGYKGIYHVFFNDTYDSILYVEFFNAKNDNLPETVSSVVSLNGKILFTTNGGILEYSSSKNKFLINERYNNIFNGEFLRAIKMDIKNNLWYFNNSELGVMRYGEDGKYRDVTLPFKKLDDKFVSGFEFVYPYNDENVFIGTEKGFAHYNPKYFKEYSYEFESYFLSMRTFSPDSVYSYNELYNNNIELAFANNSVEFSYSANDFENTSKTLYSTFLEGNDKGWSKWTRRNTRTYTNLFEGKYTFNVKSKNIYGSVSEIQSISIKVAPPFIRSIFAFIIYLVIFLLIVGIIILSNRRRYKRERLRGERKQNELFRRKEEQLQRESLETEKEIIRMRNDKLRETMKLKDKELANSTMQMLQKNEMLITLRDELKELANMVDSETHKHDVIRLVRGINKEIDNEKQWHVFETHFESVHEEFLKRIKSEYPSLTPRELKLCAYLRMNISSKEISVLMNISTRGVEISRYRLRKKLKISRETNLTEFILTF